MVSKTVISSIIKEIQLKEKSRIENILITRAAGKKFNLSITLQEKKKNIILFIIV